MKHLLLKHLFLNQQLVYFNYLEMCKKAPSSLQCFMDEYLTTFCMIYCV